MGRLNVRFSDRQKESLEGMANDLDTTMSEVLRKALALLRVALREQRAGNQIAIVKEGKVLKEIIF